MLDVLLLCECVFYVLALVCLKYRYREFCLFGFAFLRVFEMN